jgi:hypothetical protein
MSPQTAPAKDLPTADSSAEPLARAREVEAGQAEHDTWAVARFDDEPEQGTRQVRINTAMMARRGKRQFAVRLGLAVPGCPWLNENQDSGESLELEAQIHAYLQQNKAGVLPVIVCESDLHEYIVYLSDSEFGEDLVQRLANDHPDMELHYYTARDPEWEAYWALADSLGLLDGEPLEDLIHVASC